jgi:hypothetical protein
MHVFLVGGPTLSPSDTGWPFESESDGNIELGSREPVRKSERPDDVSTTLTTKLNACFHHKLMMGASVSTIEG